MPQAGQQIVGLYKEIQDELDKGGPYCPEDPITITLTMEQWQNILAALEVAGGL